MVHRLDVDTSGALLFATEEETWQRLRRAFTEHRVEKIYRDIQTTPPVLFAQVEESWELLSDDRRREEAETVFSTAEKRWGARDGFLHRGDALVAQHWEDKIIVYGGLHGEEWK